MKILKAQWLEFKYYLYLDRKLSDKPSSVSAEKSRFNKLSAYFEEREFNRENFNLFVGAMKDKGYTASYINNLIKTAKLFDRWKKTNLLADYTYFKQARKVNYDILTAEEIMALAETRLKYAKQPDYINLRQKALILLLGTTGCRIGEALGLKFDDIYSVPPYVLFRDTKNNDDRQVPISKELYDLLVALPHRGEYVFASGRSGKLECQQVNLDLKRRADKVGIKKHVWCHLFRHSFVTTMLEADVDALDVAVIVGHRDPRNTLRYKNSLIGHYVDVIHFHPLLRKEMPWESRTKNLKDFINKTFDSQNHIIGITLGNDDVIISIKRNKT